MRTSVFAILFIALWIHPLTASQSGPSPDFDGDGMVGFSDFLQFADKFGSSRGDGKYEARFDLDGDGSIGFSDFLEFASQFGKKVPSRLKADRDALVALYNATDGDNWTDKTNWLTDNDLSTWFGVTVFNGRVTSLDLEENNLTGAIPPQLGNLSNLESLHLAGNQLTGVIPPELASLTNLKWLYLYDNQLTGVIPPELGSLTNLRHLSLYNNQLSGTIPAELGSLSNLQELDLNGNAGLSGTMPGSFTGLDSLAYLYVNGTGLCAPTDAAFQTWLAGIENKRGVVNCGEAITYPSIENPVARSDVALRKAITQFSQEFLIISPEKMRPHPAADDFPGPVPADAPRITRSLTIDTSISLWHSTGLYAPPGEVVTVTVPSTAAETGNFSIVVGVHTDNNLDLDEWTRMPVISRRFPITEVTTPVANAFGGLIYIDVYTDIGLGKIAVEISGAVPAPYYVLGETDLSAWRDEIRHFPAPWAEIEGRNMIITTASDEIRKLYDPEAVAQTWDRILDLNAELAAWTTRAHPERFIVDRQLALGWMHSGYPLMAHMKRGQSGYIVDAEHISTCRQEGTQSNWGFFHEVGHNHQNYDWTFDGTVEVTVNLFTLYVYKFLCGIPVAENWRGSASFRAEKMAEYDFDNPDFKQWKRDPFLALVMYIQLQQAFGWDAYRQVFATYRALSDEERPKNDKEKRDQWLVRFSRQVGRNLGPFFETWGVPTSQKARDSIKNLPVWMPLNFPPN